MTVAANPTLAGFTTYLRVIVQVPAEVLAAAATVTSIADAYQFSVATVNKALQAVPPVYAGAVYNLATDFFLTWCPDTTPSTWLADLRKEMGLLNFVPGPLSGSSDESTSQQISNPEFMKGFTMGDLQQLKTPYGRAYMAAAQKYGTLWGMN